MEEVHSITIKKESETEKEQKVAAELYVCNTEEKTKVCEMACKVSKFPSIDKTVEPSISKRKEEDLACNICYKVFYSKRNLKRHKDNIHTNSTHTEKTLGKTNCEICGISFTCKSDLKKHLVIHLNRKKHFCDLCNKAFSRIFYLRLHLRSHTGEKPYACELCNRAFSRRGDLGYHYRTHTGEKPYSCDLCYKSFSRTGDLRQHLLTHTGEKPHVCDKCNMAFTYRKRLRRHLRKCK